MNAPPAGLDVPDGRRRTAVAAAKWLSALLAEGPRDSREILAKGAEVGLSAKALRHARETLKLRVVRTGSREAMRSTWSLPGEADAGDKGTNELPASAVDPDHSARAREGDPSDRPEPRCTRARVRAYSSPTIGEAIDAPAQFTDGEQCRIERRVVHFRAKGVPEDEAVELAHLLVLERDRVNERRFDGSCAECSNLVGGRCTAQEEGAGVIPRPIREVWNCWCARRPMP